MSRLQSKWFAVRGVCYLLENLGVTGHLWVTTVRGSAMDEWIIEIEVDDE